MDDPIKHNSLVHDMGIDGEAKNSDRLSDAAVTMVVCPGISGKRCGSEFYVPSISPGKVFCPGCGCKFKAKFNLK